MENISCSKPPTSIYTYTRNPSSLISHSQVKSCYSIGSMYAFWGPHMEGTQYKGDMITSHLMANLWLLLGQLGSSWSCGCSLHAKDWPLSTLVYFLSCRWKRHNSGYRCGCVGVYIYTHTYLFIMKNLILCPYTYIYMCVCMYKYMCMYTYTYCHSQHPWKLVFHRIDIKRLGLRRWDVLGWGA